MGRTRLGVGRPGVDKDWGGKGLGWAGMRGTRHEGDKAWGGKARGGQGLRWTRLGLGRLRVDKV